jgi:hypothetical protein
MVKFLQNVFLFVTWISDLGLTSLKPTSVCMSEGFKFCISVVWCDEIVFSSNSEHGNYADSDADGRRALRFDWLRNDTASMGVTVQVVPGGEVSTHWRS